MRLTEAVLMESFRDAEVAFYRAYRQSPLIPDDRGAEIVARGDIQNFREFSRQNLILPEHKDISKWIGMANRVNSPEEAKQFMRMFKEVLREAEDRIPDYDIIGQDNRMTFVAILNFAAAKKICRSSRLCIRNSKEYFDSYNKTGALILIDMGMFKYIFEYNRMLDGGAIWTFQNEELSLREFFFREKVQNIPSFHRSVHDEINEAIQYFEEEWELYQQWG